MWGFESLLPCQTEREVGKLRIDGVTGGTIEGNVGRSPGITNRGGLGERIGRVMIPTEDVMEVRGGKKIVSPRMFYPGYVLVEMEMDDDTWHVVRSTPRVTGFVGSGQTPSPLSEQEVENILHRVTTSAEKPKPKLVFERNEQVRIVDGPFANFTGQIEEVNADRSTLKVSVTIFGRSTPVELDFAQVEKIT